MNPRMSKVGDHISVMPKHSTMLAGGLSGFGHGSSIDSGHPRPSMSVAAGSMGPYSSYHVGHSMSTSKDDEAHPRTSSAGQKSSREDTEIADDAEPGEPTESMMLFDAERQDFQLAVGERLCDGLHLSHQYEDSLEFVDKLISFLGILFAKHLKRTTGTQQNASNSN